MRSIKIFLLLTFLGTVKSLSMMPQDLSANDLCATCKKFSEKFVESYRKTARSNFGGGNTDWEERKLKDYAKSETRLIEILEDSCKNTDGQCTSFIEKYEETIEEWYQKEPSSSIDRFQDWLCIETAQVCCPTGRFGKNCRRCQIGDNGLVCSANGKCDGDGKRTGNGRCQCERTFTGTNCSRCQTGYFNAGQDKNQLVCKDIDECQSSIFFSPCRLLKCQNTDGSFECTGEPFYKDLTKLVSLVVIFLTSLFFLFKQMNNIAIVTLTLFSILLLLFAKHVI